MGDIANKGLGNWLFGEGNPQVEDEAAAALEKCGVIVTKEKGKGVTSVNFDNYPKPSDENLKQIAKIYHLITALLANVEIMDDQLAYFSNLKNMTSLVLNGTPITDAGLVHLVGLPALQSLHISHNKITDKGLEQVAKMYPLAILDLSYTDITDQGMKPIAGMQNLNWLLIKGDKITDVGMSELAALPNLKHLTLSKDMKISKEAIDKLKKVIPNLEVTLADKEVQPDLPGGKPAEAAPTTEKPEQSATPAKE